MALFLVLSPFFFLQVIAWQIDNYKTNKTIAKLQVLHPLMKYVDSPTTNIIESVEEQPKTSYTGNILIKN